MRIPLMLALWLVAPAALAQESYGEPFTQAGLMQGCTTEGEAPGCMVYADGFRYLALYDGPTAPEMMAELEALAVNTPVQISGEIISLGDITAEIAMGGVAVLDAEPYADLRTVLQGDWLSNDDASYVVQINGSEWTDVISGEVVETSTLQIDDACADGSPSDDPALIVRPMGGDPEAFTCLAVMDAQGDTLTLLNLPRGNILSFSRNK
ncbi:MAG: hypothetical protein WCC57_03230 [Paracoccaceae bacterium]